MSVILTILIFWIVTLKWTYDFGYKNGNVNEYMGMIDNLKRGNKSE